LVDSVKNINLLVEKLLIINHIFFISYYEMPEKVINTIENIKKIQKGYVFVETTFLVEIRILV
jgi:hypothetical protein